MRRTALKLGFVTLIVAGCLHLQSADLLRDAGPGPDAGTIADAGLDGGEDAGPPACRIGIEPANLDFGQVTPGVTTPPLAVTISDTGTADCVVEGVSLAPGDSTFTLQSGMVVSQLLSPAGAGPYPSSLQVQVVFTPPAIASYVGSLVFTAGDPDGVLEHKSVALTGEGSVSLTGCFLFPGGWSFGIVGVPNGQYCATGKRSLVAINGCNFPVTIESAAIVPAASPFEIITSPFPLVINPNASSPALLVGFRDYGAPGTYSATLVIQTDFRSTPYTFPLQGTVATPNSQTDTFTGQGLFLSRQFPLSGTPVASSLAVSLNGTVLAVGAWSYDDLANAVTLANCVTLQPSDTLSISYWLSCQ